MRIDVGYADRCRLCGSILVYLDFVFGISLGDADKDLPLRTIAGISVVLRPILLLYTNLF